MHVQAYKHVRLMEESEWRVELAAGSDSPEDLLVRRVLDVLKLLAMRKRRRIVGKFDVFSHRL